MVQPDLVESLTSLGRFLDWDLQNPKSFNKTYLGTLFSGSVSGTLAPAAVSFLNKIHALSIQAQGNGTITINSGSAGVAIIPAWVFQAREGVVMPFIQAPAYWAKTTAINTALFVTLVADNLVNITCVYSQDDAS